MLLSSNILGGKFKSLDMGVTVQSSILAVFPVPRR